MEAVEDLCSSEGKKISLFSYPPYQANFFGYWQESQPCRAGTSGRIIIALLEPFSGLGVGAGTF